MIKLAVNHNHLLRDHLYLKTTFYLAQAWSLNTGFTAVLYNEVHQIPGLRGPCIGTSHVSSPVDVFKNWYRQDELMRGGGEGGETHNASNQCSGSFLSNTTTQLTCDQSKIKILTILEFLNQHLSLLRGCGW